MSSLYVSSPRRPLCVATATILAAAALAFMPPAGASTAPSTGPTSSLASSPSARAAEAVTVPADLRFYQSRRSILGTHTWYQQVEDGHVVVNGWYAVHTTKHGASTIFDARKNVASLEAVSSPISAGSATTRVASSDRRTATPVASRGLMVLPGRGGDAAHLVWQVVTADGTGVTASYVDASSGETLRTVQLAKQFDSAPPARKARVSGTGKVFDPNPVVALQKEDIKDQHDANYAALAAAYRVVDLPRLDAGVDWLRGQWVTVNNKNNKARSATRSYRYGRSDSRFEQVNGYHAIDAEQAFLRSLGHFNVNAESQRLKTNAFSDDNSYYDPNTDQISMGTGGVDDAEDVEVTWHEYGHAIQDDQVPGFGITRQSGAIGEGFGDYMAATMSQQFGAQTTKTPYACLMDWDSTSYTSKPHCIRRTDTDKTFPTDLQGEVHADGEIWSGALWTMNMNLGRHVATRIIIEAQFNFSPGITMPQAAHKTVAAARQLYPADATVAQETRAAFESRDILTPAAG